MRATPYAGPPSAREPGQYPRPSQVARAKFYRNFTTLLQRLYDTRPCLLLYSLSSDLRLVDHGSCAEEVCENTPATACPTHSPPRGKSASTPTGHAPDGTWACTPRFARARHQRDAAIRRRRRGTTFAREP